MARFTYHGPVQTISLAVGRTKDKDGKEVAKFKEFSFVPGKATPDLPGNNPIIASMIDAGQLVAIKKPKRAPPKKPSSPKKEEPTAPKAVTKAEK